MRNFIFLAVLFFSSSMAYSDFEEAMMAGDYSGNLFMEGREGDMYPETSLPFGSLGSTGAITIEQFVKELKKRKEAKEAKKKLKRPANKDVEQKKVAGHPKTVVRQQKKVSGDQQNKKSASSKKKNKRVPSVKTDKKKAAKRPALKSQKSPRKQSTNKRKKNMKKTTSKDKKQHPKTSLIKPDARKPVLKTPAAKKPKRKPSTNKKPLQKTKKKVIKPDLIEDDDPFNFGGSNAQQHSDHHVHHHDHLEAHKHHHKHKESHAHEHAHSNDHVHNHKHTHNHVHNHIHKHNEAHEHSAEHSHTEKHTHKHLEYIDQGGWRRRDQDPYSDGGVILEEPTELMLQEREGKDSSRGQVKAELENFINSYKSYNTKQPQGEESATQYDAILEQDNRDSFSEAMPTDRFQRVTNPEDSFSRNSDTSYFESPSSSGMDRVSPLENKSDYPVEVEEISYEEYLRLQKKGPTFEEELGDYDYQAEHSNAFGDSYTDSYGPMDQLGYGSEEHVVSPGEYGDWVDMDMDLQYDMGPEYLEYQELERRDEEGEDVDDYEEYLDMLESELRRDDNGPEVIKEEEPDVEEDSVDTYTSMEEDEPEPTIGDLYSLDHRNFL